MISRFHGEYRFLSNFHNCLIEYGGYKFGSTEAAYQAEKCVRPEDKARFVALHPAEAKILGNKIELRADWEEVKLGIMLDLLRIKFSNGDLAQKLLDTGSEELVEENWWHDEYWGICNGVGENHLGRLLMQVREEIRKRLDAASELTKQAQEWGLY